MRLCPSRRSACSSLQGITATHGLPFEVKAPTHAKFNKDEAVNRWAIPPRTLRQLMEHFGPRIELLDINADGEGVHALHMLHREAV